MLSAFWLDLNDGAMNVRTRTSEGMDEGRGKGCICNGDWNGWRD